MNSTLAQDRLIDFAAHSFTHAEPREEGDVAVFCEGIVTSFDGFRRIVCQIECVSTMAELLSALGR